MGNKIITEKDFWMCTTGAVPAQLQGTRLGTKKKSGEVYITVEDKATSSFIDFGCTKYMLLAALAVAAAVVVLAVVGVLTVATGGAALIALGAVAGLVGAAIGGIVGGLLCGQKVASKRVWSGNKSNLISQGTKTITGDHTMTCAAGGAITFAPQIKNWSQAVALGGANYLGKLMEGMMAGAAVGMGGAILSGGAGAVATGGMRGLGQATLQFAKTIPSNVMTNYLATWTTGIGLGLRGITTIESTARAYGETGEVGASDVAKGVFGMEVGTAHSATNIVNGQPGWQDIVGLALWMSPVAKGLNEGRVNSEARRARGNGEAFESTRVTPESLEIAMLKDNPTLMGVFRDAVNRLANSRRGNAYKRYTEAKNNNFDGLNQAEIQLLCEEAWAATRSRMRDVATEQGITLDGEIHHWNYPKYENPHDVLNPNQLTEPISRDLHQQAHEATTSDPSKIWEGPINPDHAITPDPFDLP
jgi:hypothetical protein